MITSNEEINPCSKPLGNCVCPSPVTLQTLGPPRNGLSNDTSLQTLDWAVLAWKYSRYVLFLHIHPRWKQKKACWISRMNRPLKLMTPNQCHTKEEIKFENLRAAISLWRLNIYVICFESIWMIVIDLDEETHSKSHWSIDLPSWSTILTHLLAVSTHTHNHYISLSILVVAGQEVDIRHTKGSGLSQNCWSAISIGVPGWWWWCYRSRNLYWIGHSKTPQVEQKVGPYGFEPDK